jgi:hypothetical protein
LQCKAGVARTCRQVRGFLGSMGGEPRTLRTAPRYVLVGPGLALAKATPRGGPTRSLKCVA